MPIHDLEEVLCKVRLQIIRGRDIDGDAISSLSENRRGHPECRDLGEDVTAGELIDITI